MARISLDVKVWSDPRITVLAKMCGMDRFEAIGRLSYFWHICSEQLSNHMLEAHASMVFPEVENWVDGLLQSGLAERSDDNQLVIKGVEERIQWLHDLKERSKKGGRKSGQSRRKNAEAHASTKTKHTLEPISIAISNSIASSISPANANAIATEKEYVPLVSEEDPTQPPEVLDCEIVSTIPKQPKLKKQATYSEDDLELGTEWYRWAVEGVPSIKASPESFAEALATVRRRTIAEQGSLTNDGLRALFQFIRNDQFWAKNALSPAGLLTKGRNGLRKIDNILASMRRQDDKGRIGAKMHKEMVDSKVDIRDLNPFGKKGDACGLG